MMNVVRGANNFIATNNLPRAPIQPRLMGIRNEYFLVEVNRRPRPGYNMITDCRPILGSLH